MSIKIAAFAALVGVIAGTPLGGVAHAYETDQLTHRDLPLEDGTALANAWMDDLLGDIVDRAGRRLCRMNDARLQHILGRRIHRRTSGTTLVLGRGFAGMWGFSHAAAWLENDHVDRIDFRGRDDIFGSLERGESIILRRSGVSSTVQLAGVRLGTDKIDHFFSEGWTYVQKSERGKRPRQAVRWGTLSERTFFGTLTSRTFSYADLRANYDGFQFYMTLLEDGSPLGRDDDACPAVQRSWDWADWINWEYDEVLNPSVYAPTVHAGVRRHLVEHKALYCAEWARWQSTGHDVQVAAALRSRPEYVSPQAPSRVEPYGLAALCTGTP